MIKRKKLKIKRIRSEIEIPKTKKTNMYFLGRRDKRKRKKNTSNDIIKGQVCHQEMLHALLVVMNIGFKKIFMKRQKYLRIYTLILFFNFNDKNIILLFLKNKKTWSINIEFFFFLTCGLNQLFYYFKKN